MAKFILKRLGAGLFQVLGVVIFVFFLLRIIPGDPALILSGGYSTPEIIEATREALGLDKPLLVQLILYLGELSRGSMGISYMSGNPVSYDLSMRAPITLELIFWALTLQTIIAIPMGVYQAMKPGNKLEQATTIYGFLSGSMPDFFVGLVLIFIFFFLLGWAPAPSGRLDLAIIPPPRITGSYTLDGILAGRFDVTLSSLAHLALPIATMVITGAGVSMKMMRATMIQVLNSDYLHYANLIGLRTSKARAYAIRNALGPVVTLIGISIGVSIGSTVILETLFSLGGIGQYAVTSAALSDYNAVLGFLIVAGIGTVFALLLVDIVLAILDPRIRLY